MAITDQNPVQSPFHAKSTADEVLQGIDLTGKNAVVTGGYSGIGLETTRALAKAGARVTVPSRRLDAAQAALASVAGTVEIAEMDLADLSSVKQFATDYAATERPLDILINNAGIMACPLERVGPGWESQFAINHLGHMAMTMQLGEALQKADAPRVVCLSSTAHTSGDVLWEDVNFQSTTYDKWQSYAQAKSACALFALGLDKRGREFGVRAFSVHPGGIFTPLQRHLPEEEMVALGWKNPDGTVPELVQQMFKTPEQGASTSVWAATSPLLENMGGVYCEDCNIAQPATEQSQRWEHARAWICDDEKADRLWDMSQKMMGAAS